MLGIFALLLGSISLGLSALPSMIGGDAPGGGDAEPPSGLDTFTDETDILVSSEHSGVVEQLMETEEFPVEPELIEGPLRVDTGGGNDVVVGGAAPDEIHAGDGDDLVGGGDGNDRVELGAGNDVYGVNPFLEDYDPEHLVALGVLELGNDTVRGGVGDDAISDRFGSNRLIGNQGADLLIGLDDESEEEPTPDVILGGFGYDHIHADEGDIVEGGRGLDTITLHLPRTDGETPPQPITITDFFKGVDTLILEGVGTDAEVALTDIEDGSGAVITLDGVEVVRVLGGAGLTLDDLNVAAE